MFDVEGFFDEISSACSHFGPIVVMFDEEAEFFGEGFDVFFGDEEA